MWIKAIKAGIFIGVGCILYLLIPNPAIGALLFSLGLLSVGLTNSLLYTGQVHKLIEHTPQRSGLDLLKIWIGNMIGIGLMIGLAQLNPAVADKIKEVGAIKSAIPTLPLLCNSIVCGLLMTMATRANTPKYVTIGCVWAFVYAGLNHCIADAFYLLGRFDIIQLLLVTLGNTIGGLIPVIGKSPTD